MILFLSSWRTLEYQEDSLVLVGIMDVRDGCSPLPTTGLEFIQARTLRGRLIFGQWNELTSLLASFLKLLCKILPINSSPLNEYEICSDVKKYEAAEIKKVEFLMFWVGAWTGVQIISSEIQTPSALVPAYMAYCYTRHTAQPVWRSGRA